LKTGIVGLIGDNNQRPRFPREPVQLIERTSLRK
jgi:hypothetical protein